mgnify:FL=1
MKILITGGCGFVGTNIILYLNEKNFSVSSLDNLSKKGSKFNLNLLKQKNIKNYNIDISNYKLIKKLPKFDLIIDCCAEPAVEVSKADFNRVINTNLIGTLNILKKCKKDKSKLIFLSSSRIYPINSIKDKINFSNFNKKFLLNKKINEQESLNGPKTLYGATKLSSELFIEEFSYAFNLKYIINRCGVISGPLQFGKEDQGFVSLWVWRHILKKKLKYIGYGGSGNQVRDVLHIIDLCKLIFIQIKKFNKIYNKTFNVGGSKISNVSLKKLTKLCQIITKNKVDYIKIKKTSIYDIPYYISDNKFVSNTYNWKPNKKIFDVVKDLYLWILNNKKELKKYF